MRSSSNDIVSFTLRFFGLFALVEVAILTGLFPILGFQLFLTQLVSALLTLPSAHTLVLTSNGAFDITPFCTGITIIAIYLSLWFGIWRKQPTALGNIARGGVLLLALNALRILVVVNVGQHHSLALAETLHGISWFVLSGVALGMWVHQLQNETHTRDWKELGKKLFGRVSLRTFYFLVRVMPFVFVSLRS
mgnify:CR=1 FL=1